MAVATEHGKEALLLQSTANSASCCYRSAAASLGSTCEASPDSGDMTIKSLADVVSKLASECDESAVALCSAARTLQRGVQAEIRNLCKPWGVQLTRKNDNGKYSKHGDDVLKKELTATFIEKAREQ